MFADVVEWLLTNHNLFSQNACVLLKSEQQSCSHSAASICPAFWRCDAMFPSVIQHLYSCSRTLPLHQEDSISCGFLQVWGLCWEHSCRRLHAVTLSGCSSLTHMTDTIRVGSPTSGGFANRSMVSASGENWRKSGNGTVVRTIASAVAFTLKWKDLKTTYFEERKPWQLPIS